MKATRIWRSLFITCALVVLVRVTPSFAERDNPYIITGYETSRSIVITPEEIAENYRIIMNSEEDILPSVSNGLACVLQSSRNKYWSNDDIFLCLRLSPAQRHSRVTLSTRGTLLLSIVRIDSGKEVAHVKYSEAHRPVRKGVQDEHPLKIEISSEGRASDWTEFDFLLTRHDFLVSGFKKGAYRAEMSYSSTGVGWVGEITSPPIDFEVLD
jgi:hypothetical protein